MHGALNFLLAALVAVATPSAAATALGEGQILSHVGERLSVEIALTGGDGKDVKFFQVRAADCRTSIIGASANGCDGLYQGRLAFSVRQRPDGQSYLRVTGEKGNELYYRLVIKTVSPDNGTVFNTFEFLPEFSTNPDAQPAVIDEADAMRPAGKYGIVGGNIVEVVSDDENTAPVKHAAQRGAVARVSGEINPSSVRERGHNATVDVHPQAAGADARKQPGARLEIKKHGDYSDDIHALQKENGEIEQQIVLLEKHIGLLKEVIRLKNQIGASSAPEAGIAVSNVTAAPAKAHAPSPVAIQSQRAGNEEPGLLTWILLGVIVVLLALLGWMYRTQQRLKLRSHSVAYTPSVLAPVPLNERKSLDLTDAFVKPKW